MNRENDSFKDSEVELIVADAYPRDIGKILARVDRLVMEKLGLETGDIIEIIGKKSVPAIVWPLYLEDIGKGIIRIDECLRNSAEVNINDRVRIRKVEAKPAERVVLAPTEPVRLENGKAYLLWLLDGRPVKRGQKIRVEVSGHILTLVVVSTVPDGVVIVSRRTTIELKEGPFKPIEEEIRENPKAMLKEWIDRKVVVFTTGSPIVGVLKGYDSEFNLILEDVFFLERNELKKQFRNMLVNGNNVISISLFDDLDKL